MGWIRSWAAYKAISWWLAQKTCRLEPVGREPICLSVRKPIRARITDTEVGQDQIEIQCVNRLGFNNLHITHGPNSNSVTIEFSGNQITLTGVNFNKLRPGNFIFTR